MNIVKKTYLQLLQNRIILDDQIIPVIIKDYWYDTTPCVTITGFSRDKGRYNRQQRTIYKKLSEDHPLFDEDNPDEKYPHLAEYQRKEYEIQINVWCNTEREREEIVNQVRHLLFLARNHHYSYCVNYDNETHNCRKLEEECKARTVNGYRGLRGLCPAPRMYEYCNIYKSNGILPNTIRISPDYERDEYDHKPPLKRSIIVINLDYYEIFLYESKQTICANVELNASDIDYEILLNAINTDCEHC